MPGAAQASRARADLARGQRTGSLISAVFGLIYVLVNAGPLRPAAGLPLRIAGALAFVAILAALLRGRARSVREPTAADSSPRGAGFGRAYWFVVTVEAVALFAGLAVLNGVFHAPQAGVAWVSFVVGVHFFALAAVFGLSFFHWLGAAITACGVSGLALAAAGTADAPIAIVGGILPGAILLAAAWFGASTLPRSSAA